jgi:S-adenosyl methyltransferase
VTDSTPGQGSNNRPKVDTTVAHSARVWNYWLGGKDNYPVDREAGNYVMAMFPDIVRIARSARAFLVRAVTFLVTEAGIRQFLDIGTGLPTANNTHQVAQALAPESRIVYVDNDPLVLVHARALLTSTAEGACDYIDADVREPAKILAGAAGTLDFTKPVAIMMLGILGQIADSDDPQAIVEQLLDAVPSGSYLALGDSVNTSETLNEAIRNYNENMAYPYHLRSPEQITGFFSGLEMVEPGLVPVMRWRPDASPFADAGDAPGMGGVGRKP